MPPVLTRLSAPHRQAFEGGGWRGMRPAGSRINVWPITGLHELVATTAVSAIITAAERFTRRDVRTLVYAVRFSSLLISPLRRDHVVV
jgi:hypothetical protein